MVNLPMISPCEMLHGLCKECTERSFVACDLEFVVGRRVRRYPDGDQRRHKCALCPRHLLVTIVQQLDVALLSLSPHFGGIDNSKIRLSNPLCVTSVSELELESVRPDW